MITEVVSFSDIVYSIVTHRHTLKNKQKKEYKLVLKNRC